MVEDHIFYSHSLEMLLGRRLSEGRSEAAEIHHAATVAEGLRLASEKGPFDLAVVDLMLPDGDGSEIVAELKGRYPGTPVAILSAREDVEGVARGIGAEAAIGKDLPLEEILLALEQLLG